MMQYQDSSRINMEVRNYSLCDNFLGNPSMLTGKTGQYILPKTYLIIKRQSISLKIIIFSVKLKIVNFINTFAEMRAFTLHNTNEQSLI